MGNISSINRSNESLLSVETNNIYDEDFVREMYKSSPFRIFAERLTDEKSQQTISVKDFEQFSYLLGQNIDIYKYNKALVANTSDLSNFKSLESMRSELLNRISYQIRKELEKTV